MKLGIYYKVLYSQSQEVFLTLLKMQYIVNLFLNAAINQIQQRQKSQIKKGCEVRIFLLIKKKREKVPIPKSLHLLSPCEGPIHRALHGAKEE